MKGPSVAIARRRLLVAAGAALLAPAAGLDVVRAALGSQRVAAIQFEPKLGDVAANLARVDALTREAMSKGARWVVLPEFFPTGTALHPSLFNSYQPLDGRATQLLKELARTGKAYVCGSLMARSGADAFNSQVLACPDGALLTHDKDFPTMMFESAFYAGGEDAAYAERLAKDGARTDAARVPTRGESSADGAFSHEGVGIGTALCWEIVRTRTAKRLAGKIDILLTSSGWWTADPGGSWPGLAPAQAQATWNEHQALIDAAPQRMARVLGVPVVHANLAGPNPGYASLAFDREASGRYLGSSQVVDAQGKTVARLGREPGVLIAEVAFGRQAPSEAAPDDFWFPEVSDAMRRRWATSGALGRDHYLKETRPLLAR